MHFIKIVYGLTLQTEQNGPWEKVHVEAELHSGDDVRDCFDIAKRTVHEQLGIDYTGGSDEAPAETTSKKPTAKKPPAKKAADKKPKPAATVAYSREEKAHKNDLGRLFTKVSPGWNDDAEVKKKCVALSKDLVGDPMYDKKSGEILPEFEAKIADGLKEESADL